MADYTRDLMYVALQPVYGGTYLADMEAAFWVDQGEQPAGPGDRYSWFIAAGAVGDSEGDAEFDYWKNVYGAGGGNFLVTEENHHLITESGDKIGME